MNGRGPWWAAVPGASLDDDSSGDKPAAAADAKECERAIEAMRAQAIASLFIPLEDMDPEHMFQA